jgi:hypothetical protein
VRIAGRDQVAATVDPKYHVVKGRGEETVSAKLCEADRLFVEHNLHEICTRDKVAGSLLHSKQ